MKYLGITESILRDRVKFFDEIRNNIGIDEKIRSLSISSLLFLAIYGIVLGSGKGALQAVVSMAKFPMLFLVTLIICAPSLHIFYILFGARQSINQTITLLLTAVGTTSLLLLAMAPITVFFLITGENYFFYKILNVAVIGLSGFLGTYFLRIGIRIVVSPDSSEGSSRRKLFLTIWILLYGFVGAQMAWALDPFIGNPELPFVLFSNERGNFFLNVVETLFRLF